VRTIKRLIAASFVPVLVAVFAARSDAYPPFVGKAKKFGAKDCTFCHVDPLGGPPWNDRGQWLIKEKQRRQADEVNIEWLADYRPGSAGPVASTAQQAASPAALTPVDQEFVTLEQQWMAAVVSRDKAALDRMMGDEFTLTSAYSTGELTSKEQFIKNVTQSVKGQEFTYHDSHATVYGDVAILKTRVKSRYTFDTDDRSGDYLITDVWVKRDGRWQVVSRHSSLPAKPKPQS
jgi:ketosteroid isomerase-like protein